MTAKAAFVSSGTNSRAFIIFAAPVNSITPMIEATDVNFVSLTN